MPGTNAIRAYVIRRAKEMGLRVVVSDASVRAPGVLEGDDSLPASTYDWPETVAKASWYHAQVHKIDGVIALAADVPVTVAMVAKALSLHGLPPDVAQLGADKLAMKQRLQALGVLTARGVELRSLDDLAEVAAWGCEWHVVKPVDSRGARGVQRVRLLDMPGACGVAKTQSPSGRVICEEWLPGPQVSTETVICSNGTAVTPGFLDRNYSRLDEFAPYVIEDGADAPTRLSPAEKAAVIALAEKAALAVTGGVPCTVKGDLVLTPDGPAVIELALRLSGGYMSSTLVPLNSGVDIVGAAIKLALGETVTAADVTPDRDWPVAIRYQIPPGCRSHPERLAHGIAWSTETRDEAIFKARALCDPQAQAEWALGRRS